MNPVNTKSDLIKLLVEDKLAQYVAAHHQFRPGQRYTWSELLGITRRDLEDYFAQHGFPLLKDSDAVRPPFHGDFKTIWTIEDGEYQAVWLEKGTETTEFSSRSKEAFQTLWNAHLLETYWGRLTYPWKGRG